MADKSILQRTWQYAVSIKRSVWAFVVFAALGLLSMGALGGGLYYLVFFILPASYPDFDKVHGDWVWPTMISVGMAWSIGFLIAGVLNLSLENRGVANIWRKFAYCATLWVWAYVVWFLALSGH